VPRAKVNFSVDERLQLFIGHAAKLVWRPAFKLLRGLAVTTIKECRRRRYARGLALTFVAYPRKRIQSVISELASSFSQFPHAA
jgi:hypothetical protein